MMDSLTSLGNENSTVALSFHPFPSIILKEWSSEEEGLSGMNVDTFGHLEEEHMEL